MAAAWILRTKIITIPNTTEGVRLTDWDTKPLEFNEEDPFYTPAFKIFADEDNTNDIGLVDHKDIEVSGNTSLIQEAGTVIAARGSLEVDGPQMVGATQEIDLSKLFLCTDTAANVVRLMYFARPK